MANSNEDVIPDALQTQRNFFCTKRETLFAELQETFDMSDKVTPGSVSTFLARCSELNRLKDKFEIVQEKIMQLNLQLVKAERIEVAQVTKSFNDLYYKIRKIEFELGTHACTPRAVTAPESDNSSNEIRLPKLEVPVWDGDLETFQNFWNLFNTIVHKAKYANVVKMAYLQRSLTGSPLKLIQHLNSDSYADAYQLIYDRYGNTRNLAAFYADKILSFPPLASGSIKDLQSFLDVFHTTVTAFNNLPMDDHQDFIMFQCAFRALPLSIRTLFERSLRTRDTLPSFDNLIDFVTNQCQIEELTKRSAFSFNKSSSAPQKPAFKPRRNLQSLIVTPDSAPSDDQISPPRPPPSTPTPCAFCFATSHRIYRCHKYNELTLDAKYDWLKNNKRCFRCLGSHNRSKCTSSGKCESCHSLAHHSSLHNKNPSSRQISPSEENPIVALTSGSQTNVANFTPDVRPPELASPTPRASAPSTSAVSNSTFVCDNKICDNKTVLLGTAQALIQNKWKKWEPIRLVVDGASQINLISSQCTQRLGLSVVHRETHIDGALSQSVGTSKGIVSCILAPRDSPTRLLQTEAVVVKKVCSDLPTTSVPVEISHRFSHLQLADRSFVEKGEIDFLLGAALYAQIFENNCGIIHGEPSAMQTIFGWIIIGNVNVPQFVAPSPVAMVTTSRDVNLDRTLQAFWQSEEVVPRSHVDPLNQIAEDHFRSTHSRRPDGSYEVRLPFVPGVQPKFVNSEEIALNRWFRQEKKLQRDPKLRAAYHQFLTEYHELQHMSVAREKGEYYIPHFGILRHSPTSPLRVVFDAGCVDAVGNNLNQYLLAGPPLQKDIRDIVTFFRLKPVALIADIRMMYRFIWVNPADTKFQHILWRDNVESPVLDMELKTLVYGQTSSPFLAQRVLQALVEDEGSRYPLASKAILETCFMDDLCTSVESEEVATRLKDELIQLMKLGGFELRKWASNSSSVLSTIPQEHQLPSLSLHSEEPASLQVLGLQWDPQADHFTYKVSDLGDAKSKREVASRIASLFDPLGWVSPVVFTAKLFLRQLWESNLDWDTPLPPDLHTHWREYSSQFSILRKVKIPRLLVDPHLSSVQLVGFCDASCLGYAAVLYLRSCSEEENQVCVKLISSKSKVAPLKPLTVPRLELNAALLLAKMVSLVQPLIRKLSITELYLLSDSTVALGWLHTPPHLLHTYVANRVVSILESTKLDQWHHVSTTINIADVASRGALPEALVDNHSWWAGPEFLYHPVAEWPLDRIPAPQDLPEVKTRNVALPVIHQTSDPKPTPLIISIIDRYSSLSRVKRVLAWILRFIHNCKHGKAHCKLRKGVLQPVELQESLVVCIKATQGHYFEAELNTVKKGKRLPAPLRKLSPFLQNGVLRVGGRLGNSLLPEEAKHPPLLPKNSKLSELICIAYHRQLMHAGPQATQAAICQEFWILSLRNTLRRIIFKCGVCHRHTIRESHPKMADLPASRVTPCAPFSRTAVDYAGPVFIKQSSRRNAPMVKAWISVFVCMVTKGVHLELVSSLSSECFTAALNRFIGRRGLCKDIYCDNGTNFRGACAEEKEICEFLQRSHAEIANSLADRHIMYHFNPPEAPWMGGIFEAAVKSAKRHMRHISTRSLTYEELNTVLVRVEAVLNSRPLCPIGDDPDSFYLSPAHFLIGRSLLAPVERDMSDDTHLSRWQSVLQASQTFWTRWSRDYLHTLIARNKWTEPRPPLKEGDVVIVMRQNTKPLDWPLGRILKLHHGADGTARSATIRTTTGVYVRPTARLSPLRALDTEN